MHKDNLSCWHHEHAFSQDERKPGESRTLVVIAITATMMVVEIVSGLMFGSMALLADGRHMASHTVALGLAACGCLLRVSGIYIETTSCYQTKDDSLAATAACQSGCMTLD